MRIHVLDVQIVVLAKQPLAGRTKTRLCPPLTLQQAAEVARASLLDTLDVVLQTPVRRRLVVLDGIAEGLIPAGFDVLPQRGNGLDERLAAAMADAFADCSLPLLLVGMDTPQVSPSLLTSCLRALSGAPSALGLAEDGGWWVIGLHAPDEQVFLGVPMSSDRTGDAQQQRLVRRGVPPVLLPTLRDIDTVDDLVAVAALVAPYSRLAAVAMAETRESA